MRKCPIEERPIEDTTGCDAVSDIASGIQDPDGRRTGRVGQPVPPHGPLALDQAATRLEMARQLAVCYTCRRCVALCDVFPLAFDQIAETVDEDPARCTPFQQDIVVDRCTFCAACTDRCVHSEPPDSVDVMAVLLRMQAMRMSTGQASRSRTAARAATLMPGRLGRASLSRSCLSGDGCHDREGVPLGCCGAGELFAGNVAGYERLNSHLQRSIRDRVASAAMAAGESDVSVADPRCARIVGQTAV